MLPCDASVVDNLNHLLRCIANRPTTPPTCRETFRDALDLVTRVTLRLGSGAEKKPVDQDADLFRVGEGNTAVRRTAQVTTGVGPALRALLTA